MIQINRKRMVIGMLAVILLAVGVALVFTNAAPVSAQNGPTMNMPQAQPKPPTAGPGSMPPMPGMMPQMPAITAADGYVYVVKGNTLFQFSGKTLKLVNRAELMTNPAM